MQLEQIQTFSTFSDSQGGKFRHSKRCSGTQKMLRNIFLGFCFGNVAENSAVKLSIETHLACNYTIISIISVQLFVQEKVLKTV